jgi:hypothetical protein
MATPKLSRSVPIPLIHDYSIIPVTDAEGCQSCYTVYNSNDYLDTDPNYPLIKALYQLDVGAGVLRNAWLDQAQVISSAFSRTEYDIAISKGLATGIYTTIVPVLYYVWQALPPTQYILSPRLDQNSTPGYNAYVIFLLALVGGYKSPQFNRWFIKAKATCCSCIK